MVRDDEQVVGAADGLTDVLEELDEAHDGIFHAADVIRHHLQASDLPEAVADASRALKKLDWALQDLEEAVSLGHYVVRAHEEGLEDD